MMKIDNFLIPKKHDRRIKLNDAHRADILKIRKSQGLSYNKLAQMFGVSKRLVIFICNPDAHKNNLELRRAKGGNYYSKLYKSTRTETQREFRENKKQLLKQNKLIKKA